MSRWLAAVLGWIALQAMPIDGWAQELAQNFYHNAVFRNFEEVNRARVLEALDAIVDVVESEEFRGVVINFTDNTGQRAFLENNGKTNEEIYQIILDGAEKLRPNPDRTIDLDITWYHSWNNTVGYTYPDSPRIWVNGKYYSKYDIAGISRNLFHEWTHKLGFGHTGEKEFRPWTVPYGLGSQMERLVRAKLAH